MIGDGVPCAWLLFRRRELGLIGRHPTLAVKLRMVLCVSPVRLDHFEVLRAVIPRNTVVVVNHCPRYPIEPILRNSSESVNEDHPRWLFPYSYPSLA